MTATVALPLDTMQATASKACTLLKVLANRDRFMILWYLSKGEAGVSELEKNLGIVQPTLSQQLAILREEELVTTRREWKNVYYSLASNPAVAVLETVNNHFPA